MKKTSRVYRLTLDSHTLGEWEEINKLSVYEIYATLAEYEEDSNVIRLSGYTRTSSGLQPQFSLMGQEEIELYLADMGFGDDD